MVKQNMLHACEVKQVIHDDCSIRKRIALKRLNHLFHNTSANSILFLLLKKITCFCCIGKKGQEEAKVFKI